MLSLFSGLLREWIPLIEEYHYCASACSSFLTRLLVSSCLFSSPAPPASRYGIVGAGADARHFLRDSLDPVHIYPFIE